MVETNFNTMQQSAWGGVGGGEEKLLNTFLLLGHADPYSYF